MSVCAALLQAASPSSSSSDDSGTFEATNLTQIDCLLGYQRSNPDIRIRQRLEASRQGMLQLDALRNKHQKMMEEMRLRLSRFTETTEHQNESKNASPTMTNTTPQQTEVKAEDSRSDSPMSCCFSHRSSVSMDSGCVSISSDPSISSNSPTSYTGYRKLSNEDRPKPTDSNQNVEENQKIVATAIESTTALRCHGPKRYIKNWQRPKSMCAACPEESPLLVDAHSFSQITPPPIHRKFTSVARSESVQTRRPPMVESCLDIRQASIKEPLLTPTRFAVNQSPVMNPRPLSFAPTQNLTTSPPLLRIRTPQKPQSIFHASRVFVDRSPRNARQRPKSMYNMQPVDPGDIPTHSNEPATILTRQQSYTPSSDIPPFENNRKFHVIETSRTASNITLFGQQNRPIIRRESCQSTEAGLQERPRRRLVIEKEWKESEDL